MRYLPLFLIAAHLFAADAEPLANSQESSPPPIDVHKLSEAFGHLIGRNLEAYPIALDEEALVRGLKDAFIGKPSPMSEEECSLAIARLQEEALSKVATRNLSLANEFMQDQLKEKAIVALEPGKLHYICEKEGSGQAVAKDSSLLVRYQGTLLDGKVFGASLDEEVITLNETIPGFSKGLVGMKEGEKRTLYIHPDLGYGTSGFLPPNALLIFNVEVVKAQVSPEQRAAIAARALERHSEKEVIS